MRSCLCSDASGRGRRRTAGREQTRYVGARLFIELHTRLVEAVIRLPDRTRKVTEVLGSGHHRGIRSMLTGEPSLLELRAKSDVTLIRIDLDCLRCLLAKRPERAERLARIVKERVDAADAARAASRQPVGRLSLRDIRQRIEGLMARQSRSTRRP